MAVMNIAQAQASLDRFALSDNVDLRQAPTSALVETMIAWYIAERANDALGFDQDGDMLLFQWGTFDWGDGPSFQYGLTRQLISAHELDNDAIWQLGVTRHYEPTDQTQYLASGERWCPTPAQVPAFRAFIGGCPASAFASTSVPTRTEIRFELAG